MISQNFSGNFYPEIEFLKEFISFFVII